ncbi:MAG: Ig-like domain-containing protein [Firmicutes bacterium]|nr:Ig-like domain-containing protein [Bacillota bacterium]
MKKTRFTAFAALFLSLILCFGLFSGCARVIPPAPAPSPSPVAPTSTPAPPKPSPSAEPAPTPSGTGGGVSVAPAALGDVEITPLRAADDGVIPGSRFLLKTAASISGEDLIARLSVRKNGKPVPQAADGGLFTVEPGGGANEYTLSFNRPLDNSAVYNLVYTGENKAPLSYAFQTSGKFAVTGTTPGMWSYSAPVDTGIEIDLNRTPAPDYAGFISVSPNVAGRFEQAGNKIVFVPEGLKPNTGYTVTVGKGLRSTDGEELGADYGFQFYTAAPADDNYFDVDGDERLSFIPDDGVYFHIYSTDALAQGDFEVTVYGLKTADAFLAADGTEPPQNAEAVGSFTTKLVPDGNAGSSMYYLVDPVGRAPGYYFYEIKTSLDVKDYSCGQLAQVSYLSVYSLAINGEEVFWVNDSRTGEPAEGASIAAGGAAAATGADGTARAAVGASKDGTVRITYGDYPEFVYGQKTFDKQDLPVSQRYFSYIYTDRASYKKNDTVDVFGVLRPIRSGYALKDGDAVEFRLGDMISVPVTPDAYGAFSLEIPVKGMFGYVQTGIYLNGELVRAGGVYFLDYNRDGYVMDESLDRHTYFPGEEVAVSVSVKAFDGSPAAGVELREANNLAKMTTDASGAASCRLTIPANPYVSGWSPYRTDVSFSVYGKEDYSQYVSAPYYLLQSDVMLDSSSPSPGKLEFTANHIDRAALEKWAADTSFGSYYPDESVYRGAAVDLDFTLTIEKNTYVATQTGESYDFIQKRNVPRYDYNVATEVYRTIEAKLRNGKLLLDGLPVSGSDPLVYYTAKAAYMDSRGHDVSVDVPMGGTYQPVDVSPANRIYYFQARRAGEDEYRSYGVSLFAGETGSVRVAYDGMPPDETLPGKMLVIPARDSLLGVSAGDPNGAPIQFKEDWISSVSVYGAYFDGKHMYAVRYPLGIYYDSSERGLGFSVSFDKDKYGPGDEVTATVKITDAKGNPKKALVNVSVVDEAVFGPSPNDAWFLQNLYASAYYYGAGYSGMSLGYYIYSSYDQKNEQSNTPGGGAEKGSGGADFAVRKDFADNPGFVTAETDDNGAAAVSFRLSDAITSWRVTTHAITADNFAGNAKNNVITTKPYYLSLVMQDTYVAGDDVGVLAKSLGTGYRLNETQTEYRIAVSQNGGEVYSETITSASFAEFNAGKLPEGDYTVTVYADYGGGNTDAVEKPVTIVKDPVVLRLSSKQLLTPDSPGLAALGIAGSPVTLTFSNGDMRNIMDILWSCTDYGSYRTDYMAATAFAEYFTDNLRRSSPPDYAGSVAGALHGFNATSTALPEVVYGDPDPLYTARFAAAFPEVAGLVLTGLGSGMESALTNPDFYPGDGELNAAAGYLTLAALGKGSLLDVRGKVAALVSEPDQAAFADNYTDRMRMLFYAAALCALGDDAGAAELLARYTEGSRLELSFSTGANGPETAREYLDTMYLYIDATIDPVKAYQYLLGKDDNSFVSDVCEKVGFLKKCVPLGGLTSEIRYTLDGKTADVKLSNFRTETISITKEQYDSLGLQIISGNTGARVSFYGGAGNLDPALEKITADKTVSPAAGEDGVYDVGFTVTLPADAKPGYYTLVDRVPSNMRFLSGNGGPDGGWWVNSPERQVVDIGFVYDKTNGQTVTFQYQTAKVSDFDAVAGRAYVARNFRTDGIWGGTK